ncbi:MAG TPA: hypothetical protein VFT62_11175, partial [Mycobacteriales bacterium]|nr:hypothetical protein [Mycobacteriales bacterium]
AGGGTAPPPLPSGSATGALPGVGAGAAPPVVASSAPATAPSAAPAAAATPATDNTAHDVALAMLILLGVLIIATSGNQLPRTPRLLGGAARAAAVPPQPGQAVGAAAAATATAGAGAGAAAAYGQRGLGRFAKQRTDPPRPLI